MPEVSEQRRRLRGQIAGHTRWGRVDEAAHARTALAIETVRERVEALSGLTPTPGVDQVDVVVEAAQSVRDWATKQAKQAPALGSAEARTIAGALHGNKRGAV